MRSFIYMIKHVRQNRDNLQTFKHEKTIWNSLIFKRYYFAGQGDFQFRVKQLFPCFGFSFSSCLLYFECHPVINISFIQYSLSANFSVFWHFWHCFWLVTNDFHQIFEISRFFAVHPCFKVTPLWISESITMDNGIFV